MRLLSFLISVLYLTSSSIAETILLSPGQTLESVEGVSAALDPRFFEQVRDFSRDHKLRRIGSGVGRLEIKVRGERSWRGAHCTGTLVSEQYVLTAYHCLTKREPPYSIRDDIESMRLRLGYLAEELGQVGADIGFGNVKGAGGERVIVISRPGERGWRYGRPGVYDGRTGAELLQLHGYADVETTAGAINASGTRSAIGLIDGSLLVWDTTVTFEHLSKVRAAFEVLKAAEGELSVVSPNLPNEANASAPLANRNGSSTEASVQTLSEAVGNAKARLRELFEPRGSPRLIPSGSNGAVVHLGFGNYRGRSVIAGVYERGSASIWETENAAPLMRLEIMASNRLRLTVAKVFADPKEGLQTSPQLISREIPIDAETTLSAVALAPNGTTAAVGTDDGRVYLIDLGRTPEAEQEIGRDEPFQLGSHNGRVGHLAFSSDGVSLITAGDDRTARVWNISSREQQFLSRWWEVTPTPEPANFSPVDKLDYAVMKVKSTEDGEYPDAALYNPIPVYPLNPTPNGELFVLHYPEGQNLRATRTKCRILALSESERSTITGTHNAEAPLAHRCDTRQGSSGAPIFDDKFNIVVGIHHSGVGRDRNNYGKHIVEIINHSPVLTRLKLKQRPLTADEEADRNRRLAESRRLVALSDSIRMDQPVRSLLLSAEAVKTTNPDDTVIAAARSALTKSLFELTGIGLSGHSETVFDASFSANDELLATAARDGTVRVWNIADPKAPICIKVLREESPEGYITSQFLAFNERSKRLISATRHGATETFTSPKVWPLDTAGLTSEPAWLISDRRPAIALGASHSGDLVAVADTRNRLSIFSIDPGLNKQARVLSVPPEQIIKHVFFSSDDTALIATTSNGRVLMWDLSSSKDTPTASFDSGHRRLGPFASDPINIDLVDLNRDRGLLLTASSDWSIEGRFGDPTIRIWQLNKLAPSGKPWIIDQSDLDVNKYVKSAFFDENAGSVVGVAPNGIITVWDLSQANYDARPTVGKHLSQTKINAHIGSATHSWNRELLVLSHGKEVSVVNVSEMRRDKRALARKVLRHDNNVEMVALSRSKRYVMAAGIGGDLRLVDLGVVDPLSPSSALIANPYSGVKPVTVTSTGRTTIVLRGSSLEVWNIAKPAVPQLLFATEFTGDQFGDCVSCQVILSPDERWVAFQDAARDQSRVVEIDGDAPIRREFVVAARTWRNTEEIMFSQDGRWLFVAEQNNVRAIYDLQRKSIQREEIERSVSYYSPTLSPNSKWVIFRRYLSRSDNSNGRETNAGFIAPVEGLGDRNNRIPLAGFLAGIGAISFSDDGRWVAIAGEHAAPEGEDKYVKLMRLGDNGWETYADLFPIEYASVPHFSPDGQWLLTVGGYITIGDRNVSARIWNLAAPASQLAGSNLPDVIWNVKLAKFSPDSKWLVTVSGAEPYAKLWALNGKKVELKGKLAGPIPKLNNRWHAVFTPDSKSVAVWTIDDPTPFLWRLDGEFVEGSGAAIPNGDRAIEDVRISDTGQSLTILNSGVANTATSGTAGVHVTAVDLGLFPLEGSYVTIPIQTEAAYQHVYREELGFVLVMGSSLFVASTDLKAQLERAGIIAGRNLSWAEWTKAGIAGPYRQTFLSQGVGADVIAAGIENFQALVSARRVVESIKVKGQLIEWTRKLADAKACNELAWALAKQRDGVNAQEFSSCALGIEPDNPNYRDTRGVAFALLGRTDDAVAEFAYFIARAKESRQLSRGIAMRQKWIQLLRSGKDPFANGFD